MDARQSSPSVEKVADASGTVPIVPATPRVRAPAPARPAHVAGTSSSRRWFAIDEAPRIVAFATTTPGRIALFVTFGLLLAAVTTPVRIVPIMLAGAACAAFWKEHRDIAVLVATAAVLALDPTWYTDTSFQEYVATLDSGWLSARTVQRLATVGLFGVAALALRHVARNPTTFFARRPVVSLLSLLGVATVAGLVLGALGITSLWLVIATKLLAVYLWFFCYAVVDQRSKQRSSLAFSLGLFHPFWGSSSTPIGKGSTYLAKLRPKDSEELARVQLKGLKLLVWSFVLQALSFGLATGAAQLGIAPLETLVREFSYGEATSVAAGWAAMVLAVAIGALDLAVWGHRVVACARLAGFHLRRNTWRPLESRSLADFWNRYYYYFKELLLDFFFYPTFFRAFKTHPRLRTFCATFMAAGVGNALYHFVRDIDRVFSLGPVAALEGYASYLFYCVLLASGIALSQVRTGNAPRSNALGSRVRSFACVWGFVICIHVFGGIEDRTLGFATRASFTLHQLGLGT
jgi:hypothetical protein